LYSFIYYIVIDRFFFIANYSNLGQFKMELTKGALIVKLVIEF